MSAENKIDIAALERSDRFPTPRRWPWLLLPLVFLGVVAIVFRSDIREAFEERRSVSVIRPRPAGNQPKRAGRVLVQTAGWVEPDPDRSRVTALHRGVVAEMLVEEGDLVEADDELARLIADDAQIELDKAQAERDRLEAELDLANTETELAEEDFENAVTVRFAEQLAERAQASGKAELARRRMEIEALQASVDLTLADLETQRFLAEHDAAGPWQLDKAKAANKEARARRSVAEAAVVLAEKQLEEAASRLEKAREESRLRIPDRLALAHARGERDVLAAKLRESEARLAEAKLRRNRCSVRSPLSGVVLRREAYVGAIVGPNPSDLAIVDLYDPKALRLRLDIPQTKLVGLQTGLDAEIRSPARDEPYRGRLLRVVERADIQKVTLEVQIRVLDPDAALKPEMLCQVAVLAAEGEASDVPSVALAIPERLIVDGGVWVVDSEGRAEQRELRLGEKSGEDRIVLGGLNLSDKVVSGGAQGLRSGMRLDVEEGR